MPESDERVSKELERLTQVREDKGISTGASAERSQTWVKQHMGVAEKREIQWPIKASEHVQSSPWYRSLPARQREVTKA